VSAREVTEGTTYLKPLPRDRDAEKLVLRRHRAPAVFADIRAANLGDLLESMLYVDGINDTEPLERRALGTLSNLFDVLSYAEDVPEGLFYCLSNITAVLAEIGARLQEAGPVDPCRVDEPADSKTEISQLHPRGTP
jgi:hypothetical protein